MIINKDTVEQEKASNPFAGMDVEAVKKMIPMLEQKAREQQMTKQQGALSNLQSGPLGTFSSMLKQQGGYKEDKSDLNDFIMKEHVKRLIEGDPAKKYRREQEIKAEMEAKDPYKKSQLDINNAILESIKGGKGGDLVYRNQLTGEEVPQEQALLGISRGEQFIINRRVTSRQGVKEESVSKPKELTEGEVKTLSGAEEVMKEIGDLEKIIQSEPTEAGASAPFFGKSAQAQGVKIPFVAPYGISEKGQEYRTLRESINNRLLYLRSGAQINDKEYQRLSGMLPELFRADKIDLQQLTRFKNEFKKILQRIQSGRRGIGDTLPTQATSDNIDQNLPTSAGQTGFKIIAKRASQ